MHNTVVPHVVSVQPLAQQILTDPLLTHSPLAQSVLPEQTCPFAFLQVPSDAQANPVAHWALVVQEVTQAVAPHTYGAHAVAPGALQLPAPSQEPVPPLWLPPVHDIVTLQVVPVTAIWQPPEPLHWPVLPQVEVTGQKLAVRGAPPAAVGVHVPGVAIQVWQSPEQALLQQTPSTQNPPPQSVFAEQAFPRLFLQLPLKHAYPFEVSHSLSCEHWVTQAPPEHA